MDISIQLFKALKHQQKPIDISIQLFKAIKFQQKGLSTSRFSYSKQ